MVEEAEYVPDLSAVDLMIATPCMNAQYDSRYLRSLFRTIREVEKYGAKTNFAEVLYGADIALAREKILGVFYRSRHTHLLMIDADMGWNERDVVRMLIQEKDFIGAAGPKKLYPIQFAANKTDEHENKLLVELTPETGMVEVHEVGMAFVLVSKNCVNRMVEAYPQLSYYGDVECKELNYALFDPMLIGEDPRRRFSEDYAFCRRWRDIGGRVELLADVRLDHTGNHTFSGAFIELFSHQGPRTAVMQPPQEEIHGQEEKRPTA